jgi:hypothetical protein
MAARVKLFNLQGRIPYAHGKKTPIPSFYPSLVRMPMAEDIGDVDTKSTFLPWQNMAARGIPQRVVEEERGHLIVAGHLMARPRRRNEIWYCITRTPLIPVLRSPAWPACSQPAERLASTASARSQGRPGSGAHHRPECSAAAAPRTNCLPCLLPVMRNATAFSKAEAKSSSPFAGRI